MTKTQSRSPSDRHERLLEMRAERTFIDDLPSRQRSRRWTTADQSRSERYGSLADPWEADRADSSK
ncbi:hypothetical protein [Streptomyces sp. NBC_00996]|uniref:hypothetical protein n=1 Tax=Streptomyces sp. NBC_00996 TaxID=2903710 RepID=UPI00386FD310|nr:hypothetical protein OG390_26265 [Streptomyces sp. NBC_00996]